jgi:hypothetical protein
VQGHFLFDLSLNTRNRGISHNRSNACRLPKICRPSTKGAGFRTISRELRPNFRKWLRFSLYAALETRSGEILGKTAPRHTSAEFVDFLAQVVASQPPGREIHVIADNLATHKTRSSSTSSRRVILRSTFTLPPPILRG